MKIKEYKKEYKSLYAGEKRESTFNRSKIDFKEEGPQNLDEYVKLIKDTLWKSELEYFDGIVKNSWLKTRFIYNNDSKEHVSDSVNFCFNAALAFVYKNLAGFDSGSIFSSKLWTRTISSYLPDFFPDLKYGNPFKTKYEYPYKVMNLECLHTVSKMDERLELLKIGEERNMTYAEFVDYVINYYKCLNDELGEKKYSFIFNKNNMPSVKKNK